MDVSIEQMGQLAAIATSLCWGVNAMLFTSAGRLVGSDTVTHVRLWMALVLLSLVHLALYGTLFPWNAGWERMGWLGLSGAVGFVLGDIFLFEAFVLIGTGRALVVKTLAPAIATFLGWIFLHETLSPIELISVAITLAGILFVVSSRPVSATTNRAVMLRGAAYAFLGALGQALGVIFSREGLSGNFSPISATLIRVFFGLIVMFCVAQARGRTRHHIRSLKHLSGMTRIAGGTILGPVVGVSLSLYALQHTTVGIASTLMEMAPVVVLLISALILRERVSKREWIGTGVALAGTVMLFLF